MKTEIELVDGVEASIDKYTLTVKGPKGEVVKELASKKVSVEVVDKKIVLTSVSSSKRDKKMINTFTAHINNMVIGAKDGYTYKLKICSGHFPMNVTLSGDTLSVKNLFGEKTPRLLKFKPGSKIKVDGDIITVESPNKEFAGQAAADIEQLTKRSGFDRRIFQDGIYITEKAGKELK